MTTKNFVLWLTGLPASGKTSIAKELVQILKQKNIHCQLLDSDEMRQRLTPNPTYSEAEREQFYRTLAYIAELLTGNGVPVIIAATGHKQHYRDAAREHIANFAEIYVKCSLATAMARDTKGIYQMAQEGKATAVPGLQVPYEAPTSPEIIVDTDAHTAAEGAHIIFNHLTQQGMIKPQ
ncbi:MAG: adenylyl-sulfate kinase [Anaerolineaceae bacterium]|nr:adenylyl-sulfate kinase [Anaerolineaceae bacterium]